MKVLVAVVAMSVAAAMCAVAEVGAEGGVKVKVGDGAAVVKMVRVNGTLMVKKDAAGAVESIVIQKAGKEGAAGVEIKLIVADQDAAVALDGKKVSAKGTMEGDALKVASIEEAKEKVKHEGEKKEGQAKAKPDAEKPVENKAE